MNDLDELDERDAALVDRVRATLAAVAASTPVDGDGLASYVRPPAVRRRTPLLAAAAAATVLALGGAAVVARSPGPTPPGAPTAPAGAQHLVLGQGRGGLRLTAAADLDRVRATDGATPKAAARLLYRSAVGGAGTAAISVLSLPLAADAADVSGTRPVTTQGEELASQFSVGRLAVSVSARGVAPDAFAAFVQQIATTPDGTALTPPIPPTGMERTPGASSDPTAPGGTWVRYDDASGRRGVSVTANAGVIDEWALNPEFTTVEPTTVRGHPGIAFSGTSLQALRDKTGSGTVPADLPVIASLVWQEGPDSVVQLTANGVTLDELRALAEGMVAADAAAWDRLLVEHPTTVTGAKSPADPVVEPSVPGKG